MRFGTVFLPMRQLLRTRRSKILRTNSIMLELNFRTKLIAVTKNRLLTLPKVVLIKLLTVVLRSNGAKRFSKPNRISLIRTKEMVLSKKDLTNGIDSRMRSMKLRKNSPKRKSKTPKVNLIMLLPNTARRKI